jgi:GPH family glycoside/pentoside/hexuronide:cation symporter
LGYLSGDLGNDLMFLFASSYLMVFYTNVAGLSAAHVGTLFLITRVLDGFTDVLWGRFLDKSTPSRAGRFRPWIARAALPLVVCSALLYVPFIADWSYGARLGWAAATYLLWGSVFYTMVNISYGSLASVMTPDSTQRASLSVFRGVGANIAGLLTALVPPLVLYATVDGVSQVVPTAFVAVGIGLSVVSLVFYALCYRLTRERVSAPPRVETRTFGQLIRSLARNRALLALMGTNLVLMLSSLMVNTVAAYLWLIYFNNGALSAFSLLAGTLPALLISPVMPRLVRRFGKKETIVAALSGLAVIYLVLYALGTDSPAVFITLSLLGGFGLGAYNLLVWAMVGDVVDHEEVRSGERDDGTVYAVNTWARKLGLAAAGGLGGYALAIIGFDSTATTQSADTVQGIYTVATLVPGLLYAGAALLLLLAYPLNRHRVQHNTEILLARRGATPGA